MAHTGRYSPFIVRYWTKLNYIPVAGYGPACASIPGLADHKNPIKSD